MHILLLGGTSFFGRTLAELLVQRGDTVTLLTRGLTPLGNLGGRVRHLACDRSDVGSIASAVLHLGPIDVIVDNIAQSGAGEDQRGLRADGPKPGQIPIRDGLRLPEIIQLQS